MADTFMADTEQRVRERAYRIWQEEGQPLGRELEHWEMARELVAIEDNQRLATEPNPVAQGGDRAYTREPVEPLEAVENAGEFPTLTDQGEEQTAPRRRRSAARTGTLGTDMGQEDIGQGDSASTEPPASPDASPKPAPRRAAAKKS